MGNRVHQMGYNCGSGRDGLGFNLFFVDNQKNLGSIFEDENNICK